MYIAGILQLLKLGVVSDPVKCGTIYEIFICNFDMNICLIEWFRSGENFMLIAFPVFEI